MSKLYFQMQRMFKIKWTNSVFCSNFAIVTLHKSFDVLEMIDHLLVSFKSGSVLERSLRSSNFFRKDLRIDGSVQRSEIRVEGDAVSDPLCQKRFDDLEQFSWNFLTFKLSIIRCLYPYTSLEERLQWSVFQV